MPPDPPREQGPPGLATPTQINATPTSKTVENPGNIVRANKFWQSFGPSLYRGSTATVEFLLQLDWSGQP